MTYNEIFAEVMSFFKRPDKADDVKAKIKEAIHRAHTTDRFMKDAVEAVTDALVCGGVRSSYGIVTSTFANFRDAISVQLYDETSGTAGVELPLNDTVEASMDSYGVKRIPSVMQIGDVIQVALGDTPGRVRRFVFCYLAYPTLTDPIPESWIMRNYPYLIIHDALARLYRTTGNAERAGASAQDAQDQRMILVQNNLVFGR